METESQVYNTSLRIEDVVQRAIVIDNVEHEAKLIASALTSHDIAVDILLVKEDQEVAVKYTHNRELIFVDLFLDEDMTKLPTNVSRLIQILNQIQGDEFGPYGLVVWTKHKDCINEFIDRLNKAIYNKEEEHDAESEEEISTYIHLINPPVFVINLPKDKFINEHIAKSEDIIEELNSKLSNNDTAFFFLTWYRSVIKSSLSVIKKIFALSNNVEKQEQQTNYLLMKLAQKETGSHDKGHILTVGAYKAFDSLLNSVLSGLIRNEGKPNFSQITDNPYGKDIETLQTISAKINGYLFIDNEEIDYTEIIPGNVYEILDNKSPLIVNKDNKLKIKVEREDDNSVKTNEYPCVHIAIELTPPCDAAHKKVYSRLVGGYIVDAMLGGRFKGDKLKPNFDQGSTEKTYVIAPIIVPGEEKVKAIIFDYRYLWTPSDSEIKDPKKYRLIFKFTPPLFADILQKFSSHASRLGLNNIDLTEDFK